MTAPDPCRGQHVPFDPAVLAGLAGTWSAPQARGVWAVSLIARETGEPHRIGGLPLVVLSKDRDLAVDHMMDGRDPAIWTARAVRVPRPAADT